MPPALHLLDEVVVPLADLAELGIHPPLEVDEILPSLERVSRVLVTLTDNLVEMPHRNLGHQRLLDRPAKDGLQAGVAAHLLADVVHDGHDGILVPPLGVLDGLDLATHDDDLAGRDQLSTAVRRAQVLGHPGRRDISVQGLGQPRHELVPLAGLESRGRVRGEHEVAVQVDNQRIGGRSDQRPALGRDAQNVRARLLDQVLGMARVHDRNVQAAPLVDADAEPDGLGRHGQHGGIVADEDDAARGRDGRLDDAHDVGDRETAKQRPHGEVLETRRRGRELVAERIVLHVDPDQVVQAGSGEAQDPGDLFGVEQVGRLVPVDPHAPEVVAQQVVQRVPREERQAVRNPVLLLRVVVEVGLRPLPELADRLGALLVGAGPNAQADAVESV